MSDTMSCYSPFPLAMLACISFSIIANEEHTKTILLATSSLSLIFSGILFFLDSITHPAMKARRISHAFMTNFLPQFLVLVMAVMLFFLIFRHLPEANKAFVKWVPLPDSQSDNNYSLVSTAPRFRGESICILSVPKGNKVPSYLSEKYFYTYKKGSWMNGMDCVSSEYGVSNKKKLSKKSEGSCTIKMQKKKVSPLVPFGVIKNANQKIPEKDKLSTMRYSWTRNYIVPDKYKPAKESRIIQKNTLLRLQALSRELTSREPSESKKISKVLNHLQRSVFYDMNRNFSVEGGTDPTEYFLFKSKRGWCVHFASAAALMLRAIDIPTRMVVGYIVPAGNGEIVIKDSWGHAWCEALVNTPQGKKWIIIDPATRPEYIPEEKISDKEVFIGISLVLLAVFLVFNHKTTVNTKDLRQEIDNEDPNLPDAEKIANAYQRSVRYLRRMGIEKPEALPPRTFAETMVPKELSDQFNLITKGYELISYMGYLRLNELSDKIITAQRELIFGKEKEEKRKAKEQKKA